MKNYLIEDWNIKKNDQKTTCIQKLTKMSTQLTVKEVNEKIRKLENNLQIAKDEGFETVPGVLELIQKQIDYWNNLTVLSNSEKLKDVKESELVVVKRDDPVIVPSETKRPEPKERDYYKVKKVKANLATEISNIKKAKADLPELKDLPEPQNDLKKWVLPLEKLMEYVKNGNADEIKILSDNKFDNLDLKGLETAVKEYLTKKKDHEINLDAQKTRKVELEEFDRKIKILESATKKFDEIVIESVFRNKLASSKKQIQDHETNWNIVEELFGKLDDYTTMTYIVSIMKLRA